MRTPTCQYDDPRRACLRRLVPKHAGDGSLDDPIIALARTPPDDASLNSYLEKTDRRRLGIVEAKSAGELLFRRQMIEIWLASSIQVYLDLMRSEGRAKEMAEHLRREMIKF
jgi:hypothetical protein